LVLAHDAVSGGFWCEVRLFSVLVCGASFLGSILLRGAPFLGSILGPISVHGAPFWGRFWCVARRFWARFWCTVCGGPILGRISLHGAPFWVRFWRVAFLGSILGSILVRGALMFTASGQQDLSKHEHFAFWRFVGHLLVDLKTS